MFLQSRKMKCDLLGCLLNNINSKSVVVRNNMQCNIQQVYLLPKSLETILSKLRLVLCMSFCCYSCSYHTFHTSSSFLHPSFLSFNTLRACEQATLVTCHNPQLQDCASRTMLQDIRVEILTELWKGAKILASHLL